MSFNVDEYHANNEGHQIFINQNGERAASAKRKAPSDGFYEAGDEGFEKCHMVLENLLKPYDYENLQDTSNSIVNTIIQAARINLTYTVNFNGLQSTVDRISELGMTDVKETFHAAWLLLGCREKNLLYVEDSLEQNSWSNPASFEIEDEFGKTALWYANENGYPQIAQRIAELAKRMKMDGVPQGTGISHAIMSGFKRIRRLLKVED